MTDEPKIEQFLAYAEHDRGWSTNTVKRFAHVLEQLSKTSDPFVVTVEEMEAWWRSRIYLDAGQETKRSQASRANELGCLRSFYNWATKFDHRAEDPTRRLDFPNVENIIPRPIGEADLRRLLGPLTEDAPDLRRAIALGSYSGMRVSEAAGLEWSMIDMERRRIYVRGKGGKERLFGLSPLLTDKILPVVKGNIVTAGGRPYSGATLQRKINRLMERNGIDHSYHDLRKRAATLVLAQGISPFAVAQAFGWSSIQTAQSYAIVGDETLDQIAAAIV